MGGQLVTIVGPHIWVEDGKWHCSHEEVFVQLQGVTFLVPIDQLEDVEITDKERVETEKAIAEKFPDIIRLARSITGQA
jgi:hypothetical protein